MARVRSQDHRPGRSRSAVASGAFQYPCITCAPRTISSPTSPGAALPPPAPSTHASVPGIARPTDVGRRASSAGGSHETRLHSVSPYIDTSSAPANVRPMAAIDASGSACPVFVSRRRSGSSRSASPRSPHRT